MEGPCQDAQFRAKMGRHGDTQCATARENTSTQVSRLEEGATVGLTRERQPLVRAFATVQYGISPCGDQSCWDLVDEVSGTRYGRPCAHCGNGTS